MRNLDEFTAEVILRTTIAEQNAHAEFKAARRIQALARGNQARERLKALIKQVILIQRIYRGYRDRRQYFRMLEDAAQKQTLGYFARNAILIQKTYRGHRSRKTIFDFYRLKLWLKQIVNKGLEMEEETWKYFFEERNRKLEESNTIARKLCIFIAKKLHHLLRTHQISGIYSKNKTSALSVIEKLLASFSFRGVAQKAIKAKNEDKCKFLAKREMLYDRTVAAKTRFSGCEQHFRYRLIDPYEEELRPKQRPSVIGSAITNGPVRHPNVKGMLANEQYCDNIIAMTRDFDILTQERDFCLNVRIADCPERIEQFIEVLHDFCVEHNLIEK